MTSAVSARPRPRGFSPLSLRTRRKLLASLRDRALSGDAEAAGVLIRLSGEPRPELRLRALAASVGGPGTS
jgi:hypothetical protein